MRQQLFAGLLLAVSALLLLSLVLPGLSLAQGEVWRGIPVAPENRCSPYDRDDYPYSQSVELQIIAREGGQICSPYTNECFESRFDTDIEHIIAVSEAHDSGLCAASAATRAQFASDLRNLTLASPALNRTQKRAKDAADWLPAQNRCWFARQIVTVRRAYSLTIDRREADALDRVIAGCSPLNLASIAWEEIYPSIQEIYASVQVFSAIFRESARLRRRGGRAADPHTRPAIQLQLRQGLFRNGLLRGSPVPVKPVQLHTARRRQ
ncbi:MAG: hypothetical protein OXF63_07960 [Anaerolineaceae bacterium]|nr:hypothetical protein [Anaerolineaceae bacterium]